MIEDVRQMIQEKEGVSPHQQRLFLRWRQELKNGRTLSDYHIKSKTTVRLAVVITKANQSKRLKKGVFKNKKTERKIIRATITKQNSNASSINAIK